MWEHGSKGYETKKNCGINVAVDNCNVTESSTVGSDISVLSNLQIVRAHKNTNILIAYVNQNICRPY